MLKRTIKRAQRNLLVSWRDQPTQHDIAAIQANIRRVGFVIRLRWVLILVLATYSVLAGGAYLRHVELSELVSLMTVPAFSLLFVVLYNTFYALNYRRLGNIAIWNNLQLGLDAIVVTVLVYFSGGVNSWFWSMYALFVLEATAILPRSRDAWLHAVFSSLLIGAVEWFEFAGILPHQQIPFSTGDYYQDLVFVAVRYLWQVAVIMGMASVATLIVGQFRRDLSKRDVQRIVDEATGLFSRPYFMRLFSLELRRAIEAERPLHIALIDIDHFGDFNEKFGIDAGDRLLNELAKALQAVVAPDPGSANLVARYGGEEFVVLLVEDASGDAVLTPEAVEALAGQLHNAALGVDVDGAGVTVSVGVAALRRDGLTADEILDAADAALIRAVEEGGNRVRFASGPLAGDEPGTAGQ